MLCYISAREATLGRSDLENSEYIKYGGNENCNEANGSHVADNDGEELRCEGLLLESGFVDNRLWLDEIADEDAGCKSNDGHHDAVADKVEEIEELQTEDRNLAPDVEAE